LPPLWEHSIAVASLAQQIAMFERTSKSVAEDSFTAGLLHDVGKVVLLAELGSRYRQILERRDTTPNAVVDMERELLGCTHAQVGAYLMSIWGLPGPLVHAVAFHHQPSDTGETIFSSLTAVHVADAFTSENHTSLLIHDVDLDWIHLDQANLRSRLANWREIHEGPPSAGPKGESGERENPVCR
jgi:HD-like signal output (HDOD) protein